MRSANGFRSGRKLNFCHFMHRLKGDALRQVWGTATCYAGILPCHTELDRGVRTNYWFIISSIQFRNLAALRVSKLSLLGM